MRTRWTLGMVCAAVAALSITTVAAPAPAHAKKGKLSEAAQAYLLKMACNLPRKMYRKDKLQAAKVLLTDDKGRQYAPQQCAWCSPINYVNGVFADALRGVAKMDNRAPKKDNWMPAHAWFKVALGFPAGKKKGKKPFKTSKAAAKWALSLLPAPDTKMCGATAQVVYDNGFKAVMRKNAEALVFTLESFKKVKLKALDTAVTKRDRNHDYIKKCEDFGGINGDKADYTAMDTCLWWMRRAAVGDRMIVGAVVAKGMQTYDQEWWTANKARFPKKLQK